MEMERYDVAPDNVSCTWFAGLLFCHGKNSTNYARLRILFCAQITYITLVDLLCTNGDMELGEATIASLAHSGFPTTAAMYNALIKGTSQKDQGLVEQRTGDSAGFHCRILGYARMSPPNMEKVFEIYDAMKEAQGRCRSLN